MHLFCWINRTSWNVVRTNSNCLTVSSSKPERWQHRSFRPAVGGIKVSSTGNEFSQSSKVCFWDLDVDKLGELQTRIKKKSTTVYCLSNLIFSASVVSLGFFFFFEINVSPSLMDVKSRFKKMVPEFGVDWRNCRTFGRFIRCIIGEIVAHPPLKQILRLDL